MKKEQYIALKTKLSFKTNREISFKSMVESRREGRVLLTFIMDRMIREGMFRKEFSENCPNKWGCLSSTIITFDLALLWDSLHGKNIGGARSWGEVKFGVKQLSTTTEELLNSLSPGERKRFMACFL